MALGLAGSGIITGFDSASDGFGRVLQVVRATDVTLRSTSSTSFVDVTGMSVTITPKKSTSAILLVANFYGIVFTQSQLGTYAAEYQITNSSNTAISGTEKGIMSISEFSTAGAPAFKAVTNTVTLMAYDTPATTSATTYKLRQRVVGDPNLTSRVDGSSSTSQLFAIEVAA